MDLSKINAYINYHKYATEQEIQIPEDVKIFPGIEPSRSVKYGKDGSIELIDVVEDGVLLGEQKKKTGEETMTELFESAVNEFTSEMKATEKDDQFARGTDENNPTEEKTYEEMKKEFKNFDAFQNHLDYDDRYKPDQERLTYGDARKVIQKSFETFGMGYNAIATANQFTEEFIPDFFNKISLVRTEIDNKKKIKTYHNVKFSNPRFICLPKHFENNFSTKKVDKKKMEDYKVGMLTSGKDNFVLTSPTYCLRTGKMTYSISLYIDVIYTIVSYQGGKMIQNDINMYPRHLTDIPIPVGSKYCVYNNPYYKSDISKLCEDPYHILPGYFIINGKAKCFTFQERRASNIDLIKNKSTKSGEKTKIFYHLEIRCENEYNPLQKMGAFYLDYKNNHKDQVSCIATISHTIAVPLGILFRAYGLIKDHDIYKMVFPELDFSGVGIPEEINVLMKIIKKSELLEEGFKQRIKKYLSQRNQLVEARQKQEKRKEENPETFNENLIYVFPEESFDLLFQKQALYFIASSGGNINNAVLNDDLSLLNKDDPMDLESANKKEEDNVNQPYKAFYEIYMNHRVFKKRVGYAEKLLYDSTFGLYGNRKTNPDCVQEKLYFLVYLTRRLIQVVLGKAQIDDIDHIKNKRFDGADLLKIPFTLSFRDIKNEFFKKIDNGEDPKWGSYKILMGPKIAKPMMTNISTGDFTPDGKKNPTEVKQTGVTAINSREFIHESYSLLNKVRIGGVPTKTRLDKPRYLHLSHIPFKCTTEYPEGSSVGFVTFLVPTVLITGKCPEHGFLDLALQYGESIGSLTDTVKFFSWYKVRINGRFKAVVDPKKVHAFVAHIYKLRKTMDLDFLSSVWRNDDELTVFIWTDAGRLMRPVFPVQNNELIITKKRILQMDKRLNPMFDDNWFTLIYEGCIEYIGGENNNVLIAFTPKQVAQEKKSTDINKKRFTHCEIHPCLQFGIISSTGVLLNLNPPTRVVFRSNHDKQAIGTSTINHKDLPFNSLTLMYPQRPIVDSGMSHVYGIDDFPNIQNAVVAIITKEYAEEDAVVLNRGSLERGMFRQIERKIERFSAKSANNYSEKFCKPDPDKTFGLTPELVERLKVLDEDGIVKVGTLVKKGDPLIGKVSCIYENDIDAITHNTENPNDVKVFYNRSEYYKKNDPAQVESVKRHGNTVDITFVAIKQPEIGDKFCLTGDHEVLLSTGEWKTLEEIGKMTNEERKVLQIMSFDPKTQTGKFLSMRDFHIFPMKKGEKLAKFQSNNVSMICTMNHKLYVGELKQKTVIETHNRPKTTSVYIDPKTKNELTQEQIKNLSNNYAIQIKTVPVLDENNQPIMQTIENKKQFECVESYNLIEAKDVFAKKTIVFNSFIPKFTFDENTILQEKDRSSYKNIVDHFKTFSQDTERDLKAFLRLYVALWYTNHRTAKVYLHKDDETQQSCFIMSKKFVECIVDIDQVADLFRVKNDFEIDFEQLVRHPKNGALMVKQFYEQEVILQEKNEEESKKRKRNEFEMLQRMVQTDPSNTSAQVQNMLKNAEKNYNENEKNSRFEQDTIFVVLKNDKLFPWTVENVKEQFPLWLLLLPPIISSVVVEMLSVLNSLLFTSKKRETAIRFASEENAKRVQTFLILSGLSCVMKKEMENYTLRPIINQDQILTNNNFSNSSLNALRVPYYVHDAQHIDQDDSTLVYCPEIDTPDHSHGIFLVRHNGCIALSGNSTRSGQKGVAGMIANPEDLPFEEQTGIIPDIIVNAHAFTSRMTIAQMVANLLGVPAALEGKIWNGTTFEGSHMELAMEILKKHGRDPRSKVRMRDGETGRLTEALVFQGIESYHCLKHLVRNKKFAKAEGAVSTITQQPNQGTNKNDGNLKQGEQEINAFRAYGCASMIAEVTKRSDHYFSYICEGCKKPGYLDQILKVAICAYGCENTQFFKILNPFGGIKLLRNFLNIIGIELEYECAPKIDLV